MTGAPLHVARKKLLAFIASLPDEELGPVALALEAAIPAGAQSRQGGTASKNGAGHSKKPSRVAVRYRVSGREVAAPRFKNGKLKRPTLPLGLSWPAKRYAKERRKHGVNIVQFLRSEWRAVIDAGFNELRWLRMVDPSAARAIDNYERVDPKTGHKARRLPSDIHFLTEREVTDRRLERGISAIKADPKLAEALVSRVRRGLELPIS